MTTEQLLQKRYKVIGTYPFSPYGVGDTLERAIATGELLIVSHDGSSGDVWVSDEEVCIYPNLFELLPWWTNRKVEDMPEYIKSWDKPINHHSWLSNIVIKCGADIFWNNSKFGTNKNGFVNSYGGIMIECFLPCSKSDYLTFKQSQNER